MTKVSDNILRRVYLLLGFVCLFAIVITVRLVSIQFAQKDKWQAKVNDKHISTKTIYATRGNILSDDGRVMATSQPFFMLSMDPSRVDQSSDPIFQKHLDTLITLLAGRFEPRNPVYNLDYYKDLLTTALQDQDRHIYLFNQPVDYRDYQEMKEWPILRNGRYRGGLIGEPLNNKRHYPFGDLAKVTLGSMVDDTTARRGLEFAFNGDLRGLDRKVQVQRISNHAYIPLEDFGESDAVDGADLVTTLNIEIQDAAEVALANVVKTQNAKYGVAIVMETATGEIKALANYPETENRAVATRIEPGSTMKLASAMALLEEGVVKLEDSINTGNGCAHFYDTDICDKTSMGMITFQQAFENSSNVAFSKLVNQHFSNRPERFLTYLERFGLHKTVQEQLVGEPTPDLPRPGDAARWSGTTLPSMSIGYSVYMTPLQVLTFYNAIANDGVVVEPRLVREIRLGNKVLRKYPRKAVSSGMCSPATLAMVKTMLEGVVERGTATNLKRAGFRIAGKTGTVRKLVDGAYREIYQGSFCGYFPAEKPKYTVYVLVDEPMGAYYGAYAAGPVFLEIARQVMARDMEYAPAIPRPDSGQVLTRPVTRLVQSQYAGRVYHDMEIPSPITPEETGGWVKVQQEGMALRVEPWQYKKGIVPNVKGMSAKDAVTLLESLGLTVKLRGHGKVRATALMQAGDPIQPRKTIELILE